MGTSYTWRRDADTVTTTTASHRVVETDAFIDSPLFVVFQGAGGIRRRLEGPDARLDFPVLRELQAEGATDYVAMPLLFSDGQINIITIASDRPGGFTTGDLGQVYEILPLLSRLFEVQAMRLTTKTILDTYLGTRTGERVLAGLIKRGDGTDIPAVIWYVDLRDSTSMAEAMERSRYLAALNDFFECTAGVVLDHGGEVLKFIGDAVLAIFPIQSDQAGGADDSADAAPACGVALEAARAALEQLAVLNRDRAGRDEPPLRCALALHLGKVTYGNIGVAKRLDFTVIGPAANEAARLSGLCKSLRQAVVASEEFARHAPGHLVALGRHSLRGVSGERGVFGLAEGSR
jgi:adenylate cyclase